MSPEFLVLLFRFEVEDELELRCVRRHILFDSALYGGQYDAADSPSPQSNSKSEKTSPFKSEPLYARIEFWRCTPTFVSGLRVGHLICYSWGSMPPARIQYPVLNASGLNFGEVQHTNLSLRKKKSGASMIITMNQVSLHSSTCVSTIAKPTKCTVIRIATNSQRRHFRRNFSLSTTKNPKSTNVKPASPSHRIYAS